MLRTQLYTVEGRTSYFQINRLIKNQARECTLLNRSTVYEVLRVLEAASTSHVIIACWFQKLDCFKEKCLRYCLKIVHLKLFFHFHCVSLESRLSLLCICSSDWSDLSILASDWATVEAGHDLGHHAGDESVPAGDVEIAQPRVVTQQLLGTELTREQPPFDRITGFLFSGHHLTSCSLNPQMTTKCFFTEIKPVVIVRLKPRSASVCRNHLEATLMSALLSHFPILSVDVIVILPGCAESWVIMTQPRLVSAVFTGPQSLLGGGQLEPLDFNSISLPYP